MKGRRTFELSGLQLKRLLRTLRFWFRVEELVEEFRVKVEDSGGLGCWSLLGGSWGVISGVISP